MRWKKRKPSGKRAKSDELTGLIKKAIPKAVPEAAAHFVFSDLCSLMRARRNSPQKNKDAECDIMVEDMRRNHGEMVARMAAHIPAFRELKTSSPRK